MFQRPFHVRSNAAAKGTERKRLKRAVTATYPHVDSSRLDQLLPNKSCLETISSLLECSSSMLMMVISRLERVTTHSGAHVTVSVVNKEPLYFEHEEDLFPTVYTLWQLRDLLRPVATWPLVLPKLQGGADLMLPGVVREDRGGEAIEGIQKGQTCAITLVGNRAPVGVGVSLMSWEEMLASGMRGKGFKVTHVFGDKLWELGSKTELPYMPLDVPTPQNTCMTDEGPSLVGDPETHADTRDQSTVSTDTQHTLKPRDYVADKDCATEPTGGELDPSAGLAQVVEVGRGDGVEEVVQQVEDLCIGGGGGEPLGGGETGDDGEEGEGLGEDEEDETVQEKPFGTESDLSRVENVAPQDPVKAMDDLLVECFLQALKTRVTKSDVPLLTSTFYRSHMVPLCPSTLKLDVKKSSYKKLSRFLQSMAEQGVVKVEETGKGVESITGIDFKHELVKGFSPSLLVMPEEGNHSISAAASATRKTIQVTELYMPSHKLLPVFSSCGHNKSSLLTASQVREVVTSYVKSNELVSDKSRGAVILDPVLCEALHQKGQPPTEELRWAQLMDRVLELMKPAFSISDGVREQVVRRGKLQPVQMSVVQRTGNKKVTLVDNLDLYGIPAEEVAHTVQKIAAASTTVTSVPGKRGQQVLVQGNAVKTIAKILQAEYGLPLKFIEAIDKIKQPKKKSGHR